MNQELTGSEPGLKAYYKLDETGSGAAIPVSNSAIGSLLPNGTTAGTAANIFFTNNSTILNGLPNCDPILWLKADAGVYTDAGVTVASNGQTVQQWNDQSGNNNHVAQMNLSQKPIYSTNMFNGKPTLLFSGNQLMNTISNINWNSSKQADLFVVC
jgi:hypothetical protein